VLDLAANRIAVQAILFSGKYFAASLYDMAMRTANFAAHLFTLPGEVSDSWITTGMRNIRAAKSTGKLA